MYVYLIPQGGLNDMINIIRITLEYCKEYDRILLIDTRFSFYKINFSDYFDIPGENIIYDSNKIKKIIDNNNYSIYPNSYNDHFIDICNGKYHFQWTCEGWICKNELLKLPEDKIEEDIIFFVGNLGGHGYNFFKKWTFKDNIKNFCKEKHFLINNNYLSIQIRNTDYKCDYETLYNENKELIHSYDDIYISTDDKDVLDFFKKQNLNIINFTTFPDKKYKSLHCSNINSDIKIKNMICDMYIIVLSDMLLSNSTGNFIQLIRDSINDSEYFIEKFN